MKNWLKNHYNRNLLCILLLLVIINVLATLSENEVLLQLSKPIFIPVFFMYYLLKNKFISTIYIVCLVFSFLGDFSSIIFSSPLLLKLSSLFYCLCYLGLLYVALNRIGKLNFDKIIGAYLIIVFFINIYLVYELFAILKIHIPDALEITLFSIKSIALVVLTFVAFASYLSSETKASILYLVMAISFLFSDVLYYIGNYYIHDWSFVMMDRVLHVFGLFFLFKFIIEKNRMHKKSLVEQRVSNAENLLA